MNLLARLAHAPACRSDACNSGRNACPTPAYCRVVDEGEWEPAPRAIAAVFWARVGAFIFVLVVAGAAALC
jgi:hypothetical protein